MPKFSDRLLQKIELTPGGAHFNVMIFGDSQPKSRSLVILNSVEFPAPPSLAFCEMLWARRIQTIYVNRPGFGGSRPLPDMLLSTRHIEDGAASAAEAAIISRFLHHLDLSEIVLLGMGSANPICYRLARLNPRIAKTILSNPVLNRDVWSVFKPDWFQSVIRQSVASPPGLRFAAFGVKHRMRQDYRRFYRELLQKSDGDLQYLEDNLADFSLARDNFLNISPATFSHDLKMSLFADDVLKDEVFKDFPFVALSGQETTVDWKSGLRRETNRLGLPLKLVSSGDFFAPYASPREFLQIIGAK